jgi:hypothetical protein
MEHSPYDSITFKRNKYNQFEIASAPAWLGPDIVKLDYDMLYFKVKSVGRDFVEVVGNTTTNRTTFANRFDGKLIYWPEFLLGVHSVEFPPGSKRAVRIKPLENASEDTTPFQFMRPILIRRNWMQVELQNADFGAIGKGWIKWVEDGKLLILYNLLS